MSLVADRSALAVTPGASATVVGRFLEVASIHADRTAVVTPTARHSYAELRGRAADLASSLREAGVGSGHVVALLQSTGVDLVASELAVLAVGAAYLPIAPDTPAQRITTLLHDASARVALVDREVEGVPHHIDVRTVATGRGSTLPDVAGAEDVAYVMHTSGSTGRPKGVVVPHRAILGRVCDVTYVDLGPETVVLQTGAMSFDAATFEVWGPLLNGGTLVLGDGQPPTARRVASAVSGDGVTLMFLTTALFNEIVDDDPTVFGACQVLVGGETNSPGHLARAARACPDATLRPVYGPTENTTFSTIAGPVDGTPLPRVPIGVPLDRSIALVLGPDLAEVADGQEGELWVGGVGLAQGYLGDPDLTAQRFRSHPRTGVPLYRTGDLARRADDGQLEHLGRIDDQVKIRGFRVEPGETAAVLGRLPGIEDAVVLVRDEVARGRELVAFVVAGGAFDADEVHAGLRERLPAHLLPAAYLAVDAFPLTPHHKVDRAALLARCEDAVRPRVATTPPTDRVDVAPVAEADRVERCVAAAFAAVLGLDRVTGDTDFFHAGGHSLLAMRVWSQIRQELGVEFELRTVLDHPTVAGLAAAVRDAPTASARPRLGRASTSTPQHQTSQETS